MRYIVDEVGAVNGRDMPRYVMERELTTLASGARSADELEERIRARFLPKPQVWVVLRSQSHWSILLQLEPGRESVSYYIPKK